MYREAKGFRARRACAVSVGCLGDQAGPVLGDGGGLTTSVEQIWQITGTADSIERLEAASVRGFGI